MRFWGRFLGMLLCLLAFAVRPACADDPAPTDPFAQYALGGQYLNGDGVDQDYKKADYWFRKASDQGLAIAQFYLSHAYADGKGVPKSAEDAYFWITVAARGGDKFIKDYQEQLSRTLSQDKIDEITQRAAEWKPSGAGAQ